MCKHTPKSLLKAKIASMTHSHAHDSQIAFRAQRRWLGVLAVLGYASLERAALRSLGIDDRYLVLGVFMHLRITLYPFIVITMASCLQGQELKCFTSLAGDLNQADLTQLLEDRINLGYRLTDVSAMLESLQSRKRPSDSQIHLALVDYRQLSRAQRASSTLFPINDSAITAPGMRDYCKVMLPLKNITAVPQQ